MYFTVHDDFGLGEDAKRRLTDLYISGVEDFVFNMEFILNVTLPEVGYRTPTLRRGKGNTMKTKPVKPTKKPAPKKTTPSPNKRKAGKMAWAS